MKKVQFTVSTNAEIEARRSAKTYHANCRSCGHETEQTDHDPKSVMLTAAPHTMSFSHEVGYVERYFILCADCAEKIIGRLF